ncbi:MAG: hypothetical protein HY235_13955 [Acidobacteria bacterium]|nr:hypothetical protein [Acidobacteriota bacterium]
MKLPIAALALFPSLFAQPVRLTPYRQAIRTSHAAGDPAVPKALARASRQATSADDAVWSGTDEGLWREEPKAAPGDRKRYFASKRWLPDDHVAGLHADTTGGMWVRTKTGVSHIELRRMTLGEKAGEFEKRIEQRHNRHGMVATSSLREPGELASNVMVSSDNDGLWTAMYGAAECFRYSVEKSGEALRNARRAVEAVLKLEEITGRPGYPARSYLLPSEPKPAGGIWHTSADGSALWKADTSSDEIVGHYFLYSIAWDLLTDPGIRERISSATRRITDHILDHHLTLTDIHGLPTWWGRWDSEYFQSSRGKPDSPLNAAEILSFLKTAHHITGDPRYEREYRRLAIEEGYAALTERYHELRGGPINYSDEELAMLCFYPLLGYEKDPELAKRYRNALEAWWQNMAREKNPLWIFIYRAANQHGKASLADAVWTLERIPMDLVSWTIGNSHRLDIEWEGGGDRFGRRQARTLLPADERPVMKWNSNPFIVDGGSGGRAEDDGAFFLLPYWMGRYHRLLLGQ